MERQAAFLSSLQQALYKLPDKEREKVLTNYRERFAFYSIRGRSEQEIIERWGDPRRLAKVHMMVYNLKEAIKSHSYRSVSRVVWNSWGTGYRTWLVIGIPFILISFIIGLFYLLSISLMLTPFIALSAYLAGASVAQSILNMFLSLSLVGLGMITFVGANSLTIHFLQRFIWHLRFKIASIRGVTL